jgi:hypothetical protein
LSADEIDDVLLQVAKEYVDFTGSLYLGAVGADKIYSHYALYDRSFTSGLPYYRWRRNPAHLAKYQAPTPGFSIYLCNEKGCPSLYGDLVDDVGGRPGQSPKPPPSSPGC